MGQPLVRPHRECTPRFSGWNDADFSLESPAITRDLDYGYDALGRITTVGAPTASPDETFAYDPLGVPTSLETAEYTWTYDPPTQFGEVPKRKQLDVISEHFGWDAVTGRMSWMGHWTEEEKWRRDYAYDGLGRLLQVKESLPVGAELWRHDIGYDASDQAVWEVRSESGAVTRQVWRHGGFEEDTDEGVTLQVLAMARLVDGDLFWLTQEPDGRAPWVYTDLGAEHAFEVLGATGESLVHVGAEPWHQDHMHGAQIDRSIGLVHHGVRHARVSDGLWMQPEPFIVGLRPARAPVQLVALLSLDDAGRYGPHVVVWSRGRHLGETTDPPTQFGEVPKRKQLGVISEHFGWDAVAGRMSWMGHWTEEEKWRRDYATGQSLVHFGAEPWHQDPLHGAQIDRSFGLVHHGVRHAQIACAPWGTMFTVAAQAQIYSGTQVLIGTSQV
jgi:hypothetical protein